MSLFLAIGAQTVVSDADVLAVRQNGRVEVWEPGGELCLGYLSEEAGPDQVRQAVTFYQLGLAVGERTGVLQAQARFREAVGLDNTGVVYHEQ